MSVHSPTGSPSTELDGWKRALKEKPHPSNFSDGTGYQVRGGSIRHDGEGRETTLHATAPQFTSLAMEAPRILDQHQAAHLRDELDRQGKKLVFTNGCFDLLHVGHVRYLAEAAGLGDALVIGLNSDLSVRSLKGPSRPVNTEHDRAETLCALRSVDGVCIFPDSRATALIRSMRPHIYVKGGDYTIDSLDEEERAALDEVGAEVRILPLAPARSTSLTLRRLCGPSTQKPHRPIRLGVLGSGTGSNFQAILDAIGQGALHAKVEVVISDVADSAILRIAEAHDIPTAHVDPGNNPQRLADSAQEEIRERLLVAGVDLIILAGFMRMIKKPLISTFQGRILNIHPSLLPLHRGLEAWKQALAAGDKETGATVHQVIEEIDAGEIIAQQAVPILENDTPETLLERIHCAEHAIFSLAIAEIGYALLEKEERS